MKRFYEYYGAIKGIIQITDGKEFWEGPVEDCPLNFALRLVRYFEPITLEGKPVMFISVTEEF